MSREVTIYKRDPETGETLRIPAEQWFAMEARSRKGKSAYFMPDIAHFQSPVDYEHITSRSQLREHELRNGVRQCGELKNSSDFDNTKHNPMPSIFDKRGAHVMERD